MFVYEGRHLLTHGEAYAQLLGFYLGDGCVAVAPRSIELRIYCDASQPQVIEEASEAIRRVMPGRQIHLRPHGTGCVVVGASSRHWPRLLPQHGPGRKHTRRLALAPWQQHHVQAWPWAFLRGLLHSDGCRS